MRVGAGIGAIDSSGAWATASYPEYYPYDGIGIAAYR